MAVTMCKPTASARPCTVRPSRRTAVQVCAHSKGMDSRVAVSAVLAASLLLAPAQSALATTSATSGAGGLGFMKPKGRPNSVDQAKLLSDSDYTAALKRLSAKEAPATKN